MLRCTVEVERTRENEENRSVKAVCIENYNNFANRIAFSSKLDTPFRHPLSTSQSPSEESHDW